MNLPDITAATSGTRNAPGARPPAPSPATAADKPFSIKDTSAAEPDMPQIDPVYGRLGYIRSPAEQEAHIREHTASLIETERFQLEAAERYLASRREMVSDGMLMQAKATSALASGNPAIRDRARLELDTAKLLIGSGQTGMKEAEAAVSAAQLQLQATIAQMTALLDEVAAKGKANEAA